MRKVLITGSASVIGKKLVDYFLQKGWQVYAHVNTSSIKNSKVKIIKADFTNLSEIKNTNWPEVDLLINNAAIFRKDDGNVDSKVVVANALASVMLAKKCIVKNRNIKVVNVLDSWAIAEMPSRFMAYSISKKLLAQYTEILGFYGISIGATFLKPEQKPEVFAKIAKKYSTTMDDIFNALEYILGGKVKKGTILDIAKCKK